MSVLNQAYNGSSHCLGFCNNDTDGSMALGVARPQHEHDLTTQVDRQTKEELDRELAQAMQGLSFEERQHQQEILHGVDTPIDEELLLSDGALEELDLCLMRIKTGSMYEKAEQMDPEYVHARPFRVMFLRANDYNAQAAADQMLAFFELKHEMFGEDKLARDIGIDDLDEDDIVLLKAGYIQHAGTDRSGRAVFVQYGGLPGPEPPKTVLSTMRIFYFVKMEALKSEQMQLRGVISILYGIGGFKNKAHGEGYSKYSALSDAIPRKIQATHLCVDDYYQYILFSTIIKLMSSVMKARMRVHYGSHIECKYLLGTYGIPSQCTPLEDRMDLEHHLWWFHSYSREGVIASRATNDFHTSAKMRDGWSTSSMTLKPTSADVLFDGGKAVNNQGNQRYRSLIQDYSEVYDSSNKKGKRQVVATVVEKICESGGRFLGQTRNGEWDVITDEILWKKVMQTFRNRRRINGSKQKPNPSTSGQLIADTPQPNDVIFGTGRRNPGSELLHRLIKDNMKEYESLDRGFKIQLAEKIMQAIRDQGGRFLQSAEEPGKWMEVSQEAAKERISKYFRNYRRPSKKTK